jgi:hypothetical protein
MPGQSYLQRLAVPGGGNLPLLPPRTPFGPRTALPGTALATLHDISVETAPPPQALRPPSGTGSRVAPPAGSGVDPAKPSARALDDNIGGPGPRAARRASTADPTVVPASAPLPTARPASPVQAHPRIEPSTDLIDIVQTSRAGPPRARAAAPGVPPADASTPHATARPTQAPAPAAPTEPQSNPRGAQHHAARLEPPPTVRPEPQSAGWRDARPAAIGEPPRTENAAALPAAAPPAPNARLPAGRRALPDRDPAPQVLPPPTAPRSARAARDGSAGGTTGVYIGSLEVRIVSPQAPPPVPPARSGPPPAKTPLARGFRSFGFAQT